MNRVHFAWISLLRAIAMALVVWAHLVSWWLGQSHIESKIATYYHNFFVEPFYLYQEAGHLGVLIFFLVSGWVITYVSQFEKKKEFFRRRFFRIIPTYILAFFLIVILSLLSKAMQMPQLLGHESDLWIDYVYSFWGINYFAQTPGVLTVTWTLVIEGVFYFLTGFFMSDTKDTVAAAKKTTWKMFFFISIFLAVSSVSIVMHQMAKLFVFILYILLGRVAYLGMEKKVSMKDACTLFFVIGMAYMSFYDYLYPGYLYQKPNFVLNSDLWALAIFFGAMSLYSCTGKYVRFFSDISYNVYLLHLPLGSFLLNFFMKYNIPYVYAIGATLIILCILGYGVFYYFEKPIQKRCRY